MTRENKIPHDDVINNYHKMIEEERRPNYIHAYTYGYIFASSAGRQVDTMNIFICFRCKLAMN